VDVKQRINLFDQDSKILEEIAGKYGENSNEYCALKHAAIALWHALGDDFERFKEYVVKFEGDLSPEQRSHLLASLAGRKWYERQLARIAGFRPTSKPRL
jgi:hypothetical protein